MINQVRQHGWAFVQLLTLVRGGGCLCLVGFCPESMLQWHPETEENQEDAEGLNQDGALNRFLNFLLIALLVNTNKSDYDITANNSRANSGVAQ